MITSILLAGAVALPPPAPPAPPKPDKGYIVYEAPYLPKSCPESIRLPKDCKPLEESENDTGTKPKPPN